LGLNLKSLIGKLTDNSRRGLEGAAGLCLSRTNYEVEMEHWFVKLLEPADSDMARILNRCDVDPTEVLRDLNRALDQYKTGNGGRPQLAPAIEDLIREAWVLSSINYGMSKVRSGALLLAALNDRVMGRQLLDSAKGLQDLDQAKLQADFLQLVSGGPEDRQVFTAVGGTERAPSMEAGGGPGSEALDQFTVDLTADALAGKIDPVLGRDQEIRQIIDILTRRRQNNPILTGEAGVGKTAVVEGFALRLAAGDVPPILQNVSLRSLDLGLLQAGAGVKGEFENRLKQVIQEVQGSPKPIILFIDEAHTLIGAGGQEGQNDAANLLKPALARGELRTVAATTWAEYKRYFEKDPALTRRFQVVKIEEPSETAAIEMMRGVGAKLEKHHNVRIVDEGVQDSVRLSHRYIPARQLPDKSVSVLDTACARVAIGRSSTPPAIDDLRRRLDGLATEAGVLDREQAVGVDHSERRDQIVVEQKAAEKELGELEVRWNQENDLIDRILELRDQIETDLGIGAKADDEEGGEKEAAAPDEKELAKLRKKLNGLKGELEALQGETPLVNYEVNGQTVAEVIESWTGIPAGKMMADEIQGILNLAERLGERVIGQDHALDALAQRIRTARANLDNPTRPIGVFMFVGPSGVGKTESALALADGLYGGERNLITINMSEYQEAHTVSSLKGSPPGYVGYGEGGVLTEAVRRRPYSVVLLDEVEKAHPDVMELFFQVFDKGTLEDGEGRVIDFKNTVILLTSNVGSDTIMTLSSDPDTCPEPAGLAEAIRPELVQRFPAALLGRMIIVPFYPILGETLRKIICLQLNKIVKRMEANHRVKMTYDDALIETIATRCTESESGARNIDQILTRSLLPEVSTEFLSRMAQGETFSRLKVGVDESGLFTYDLG